MHDLKTVRDAAKRLAEIERLIDAGRSRTKRVAVETKCYTDKSEAAQKARLQLEVAELRWFVFSDQQM